MCTSVRCGYETLWSIGSLREAGFTIYPHDVEGDYADNDCLCGVDVESIIRRSNVSFELDDFGDFVLAFMPDERYEGR